jgi:hypothetical protein
MTEAVVRTCETLTSNSAVVTIPDRCLEQTTPITAWVFVIDGVTGTTTKKITLPIEVRTRPSATEDIPEEVADKYTEAVNAINKAVSDLKSGAIVSKQAENSSVAQKALYASDDTSKGTIEERLNIQAAKDQVTYAATAGHADTAGSADVAGYANTTDSAKTLDAKLYKDISFNGSSSISVALTPRKAYVITFNNAARDALETCILLAIGMKTYSSRTGQGYYCIHDGSSTLTFYDSSNKAYIPEEYIGIREI